MNNPFIKNIRKAADIKRNFISLSLLKEIIDIKKSKNEMPAITIEENINSSLILTPPPTYFGCI
ncbi:MAG: hypothetical protein DRN11_03635 [Thermoplasmata archaeon]|nr:MAG: hypothetical protein DRN11_03635 [Thermoplasmata archaeon]